MVVNIVLRTHVGGDDATRAFMVTRAARRIRIHAIGLGTDEVSRSGSAFRARDLYHKTYDVMRIMIKGIKA